MKKYFVKKNGDLKITTVLIFVFIYLVLIVWIFPQLKDMVFKTYFLNFIGPIGYILMGVSLF